MSFFAKHTRAHQLFLSFDGILYIHVRVTRVYEQSAQINLSSYLQQVQSFLVCGSFRISSTIIHVLNRKKRLRDLFFHKLFLNTRT